MLAKTSNQDVSLVKTTQLWSDCMSALKGKKHNNFQVNPIFILHFLASLRILKYSSAFAGHKSVFF